MANIIGVIKALQRKETRKYSGTLTVLTFEGAVETPGPAAPRPAERFVWG